MGFNTIRRNNNYNSIISQIHNLSPKDWQYKKENNADIINSFKEDDFERFIHNYFVYSGKHLLNEYSELGSDKRYAHTYSVFFIGILIYKNTNLKNLVFKGWSNKRKGYKLFPFLWFITSLLHDFRFGKEDDKTLEENCDINRFFVKNDIDLSRNKDLYTSNKAPKHLINSINNYFKYRVSKGKIDHGISAGFLFYDRLIKNRKEKSELNNDNDFWNIKLEQYYCEAAITIATHNIWLPDPDDKRIMKEYKDANLTELIKARKKKQKINYKKFPLLFLLGLVDTIDPVKLYDCLSPEFVLNNINLRFTKNGFDMILLNNKMNFNKLLSLKDNLTWLDVEVEELKEQRRISIKFL